jgi:uncharacterized SAM-binding protein YcdF (DUF218 family)
VTPLVDYLVSVGGFALLALIAVVWMLARPKSNRARRTVAVIVVVYVAASVRVVPWLASRPLVFGMHPFTRADAAPGSAAIVLLAAGAFTVHGPYQRLAVLDQESAARVLEAAYVFRLCTSAWIISSGGAPAGYDLEPNAEVMRDALVHLGVPRERIFLESTSTTTRDEAVLVGPILRTLHPDRVLLVTTDIHMRRALGAFRAAGIDAQPAFSQDPLNSQSRLRSFIPTLDGLRFTRAVVHEYAGLVEYGLRGWLRY